MTDIIVFDKYEALKAVLSNQSTGACPFWDDRHYEQLDGELRFQFTCANNHKASSFLEFRGFVAVKDYDGELVLFQIRKITRKKDGISVDCVSAATSELYNEYVKPVTLSAFTAEQAVSLILQNTRWNVGYVEWLGVKDFEFNDFPNAADSLIDIKEKFNGELRYRMTHNGSRIVGRYIDLVIERGSRTGKRFEYGKDIIEIERTQSDEEDVVTALIGLGPSLSAEEGRMTFTDISATDKPQGDDFIGDNEALQIWGENGKHLIGVFEYSDAQTPQELLIKTREELAKRTSPRISYEMRVALLERLTGYEHERVRLGDTVVVLDKTFDPAIAVTARVIELTRCYSNPANDEVKLGNFKPLESRLTLKQLNDFVRANDAVWKAQVDAYTKSEIDDVLVPINEDIDALEQAAADIAQANADLALLYNDLDTRKVSFDEDYAGVQIGTDTGLISTRNDGKTRAILNGEDGLVFQKANATGWENILWADVNGDLITRGALQGATGTFEGQLVAATGTFAGNLTAVGGSFTGQLVAASGTFKGTLEAAHIKTTSFESLVGDQIFFGGSTTNYGARIDTTGDLARFQRSDDHYLSIGGDGRIAFWKNASKYIEFYSVEALEHPFIRMGNVGLKGLNGTDSLMQVRNSTDTAYRSMKVDELIQVSTPESKKNIEPYQGSALSKILDTQLYEYHMVDDDDRELKRFGVMYDESPTEIVSPMNGIIGTSAALFAWRAIQEINTRLEALENG